MPMKDNEFYRGGAEFPPAAPEWAQSAAELAPQEAPDAEQEWQAQQAAKQKQRAQRRRLLQMVCSGVMVAVLTLGLGGDAKGNIVNARTGTGIAGVAITFHSGWDNPDGNVVASATTEEDGSYQVGLSSGEYTASLVKDGYVADCFNFTVDPLEQDVQHNGTMMPLDGEGYTIVLTWGPQPRDLDSHLEGYTSDGEDFHVFFGDSQKYSSSTGELVCFLDVDDTSSYGPETVTLLEKGREPYYYYVHNYSGDGSMGTSGARVKVYYKSKLLQTFDVPASVGNSHYWNVFALDNGRIVPKNIGSNYPLKYLD